jgi:hypothetical protein
MKVVTQHIARRFERPMKRLGFAVPGNSAEVDSFQNTEPLLAELYGASTTGRIATGRRAGQKVAKAGDEIDVELGKRAGERSQRLEAGNVDVERAIDSYVVRRFAQPRHRGVLVHISADDIAGCGRIVLARRAAVGPRHEEDLPLRIVRPRGDRVIDLARRHRRGSVQAILILPSTL